jgi:integral membrane protein (TIGR01906 family)
MITVNCATWGRKALSPAHQVGRRARLKLAKTMARWLFIIAIPLFCLTFAIDRGFSTVWFYTRGFDIYKVSLQTGLSKEELEGVAEKFVAYFNSSEERIHITLRGWGTALFTPEEVIHFQDVKGLVILDRRIELGSLGVIMLGVALQLRRRHRPALGKALLAGGILTVSLLVIIAVGAGLNFSWLFLQFHRISFSNNFWSSDGYMTALFPYGFWYDMALFTIFLTAVAAAVIGGAGYLLMRFTGKESG